MDDTEPLAGTEATAASSREVSEPAHPQAAPVVDLWPSRGVLLSSVLIGFPGGFGLVARNVWRMGKHTPARLILLVGVGLAAAYFFLLPDDVPRTLILAINAGVAGGLYSYALRQEAAAAAASVNVRHASIKSGIATIGGGWLATAGPPILLALILGYGAAPNPALAGTIVFGTKGSGCDVTQQGSISTGGPMYWVAYLSRDARDGEVIRISERAPGLEDLPPRELVVDGEAFCVSNDGYAFALPGETITVELTIGSERLAFGQVTIPGQ